VVVTRSARELERQARCCSSDRFSDGLGSSGVWSADGRRVLGCDSQRVGDRDVDTTDQTKRGQRRGNPRGQPNRGAKERLGGEIRAQALDPIAIAGPARADIGKAGLVVSTRGLGRRQPSRLGDRLILYSIVLKAEDVTMSRKRLMQLRQDRSNSNPHRALDGQRCREEMQELRAHCDDALRN